MIRFELNPEEQEITVQQASHVTKILFLPQANLGKLHIKTKESCSCIHRDAFLLHLNTI